MRRGLRILCYTTGMFKAIDSIDKKISKAILTAKHRKEWLDLTAIFSARYLIFVVYFLIALEKGLLAPLMVLAITEIIVLALQYLIKRPRPFQALHHKTLAKHWVPTPSFPSAHSSVAFALATYAIGGTSGIVAALFVFAALIALARVYVGVHYLSDVVTGAIIGITVSLALL